MNKRKLFNSRFERSAGRSNAVLLSPLRSDVKDKNSQLLDYIFGSDPVTGMPVGDLAMYLGENTSQEVKAFIEMNLLKDSSLQSPLSIPQELRNKLSSTITDDDIEKFSRHYGEDRDSYAKRMKEYFEDVRYKNALDKETKRIKKAIEDASKSD